MAMTIFQRKPQNMEPVVKTSRLSVLDPAQLLFIAGNDKDPETRTHALEALGKMAIGGNPEARRIFNQLEGRQSIPQK